MTGLYFGPRYRYRYVDDTGNASSLSILERLAEAGGLERIPFGNPERLVPLGRSYKPRHFKLVALEERPGMQKYRTEIITNERDPSKLVNKLIQVGEIQMRCIKYVGEQRTGR